MTINFAHIPSGDQIRIPLFYAEMDNSRASYYSQSLTALLIGIKLTAGTATVNQPVIVNGGANAANTLFGQGSPLARMVAAYRAANPSGVLYALPVAEPSGSAATVTIAVTGPASAAGVISLYIGGQLLEIAVTSSETATNIGAAIAAAVNAAADLPVTATALTGTVTLTAKWKGSTGNDIRVEHSYHGVGGGQSLPAGVGLTITANADGAGNPSLTTALANLGDKPFDFIIHGLADLSNTTPLTALTTLMNDTSGRWAYNRQLFGHVYTAVRDTLANLTTLGESLNDQHLTIAAVEPDTLAPIWEYAAAYGAANAVGILEDAFRPTQTLPLVGILAPRVGQQFTSDDRGGLLFNGIATSYVDSGGTVRVERAVTTYQKNVYGTPDPSYLDSETMHQSAEFIRRAKSIITSKYARCKVANNGTFIGSGNQIVTPHIIESEMDALYLTMINEGKLEDFESWKANRFAERDSNNPNRINFLATPDYVNQLRIFAFLNQFRLQY